MTANQRISRLMCRVADGVYKKHLEARLGIRACRGTLKDREIEDLHEDIELLRYMSTTKNTITEKCCDINKLIENLT